MTYLRFLLKGKRAHFRRFYTNSSSLTYPVPPPATLLGILGAALGMGPEYGERLKGLLLSVRPLGPQRTLLQAVNHLFLKADAPSPKELRGLYQDGRTQIPLEFLLPVGEGPLAYEVYAAGEGGLLARLREALASPAYPLSLGLAGLHAWAEGAELGEGEVWEGGEGLEAVGLLRAVGLEPDWERAHGLRLYRDRFPLRLGPDRRPLEVAELALEAEGRPLPLKAYRGPLLQTPGGWVGLVAVG